MKKEKEAVKRNLDSTTRELQDSRNSVTRLDEILKEHECKLSEKEEGSKQVEASLLKLQLENEEMQRKFAELNTDLSDKMKIYEDSLSQVGRILLLQKKTYTKLTLFILASSISSKLFFLEVQ